MFLSSLVVAAVAALKMMDALLRLRRRIALFCQPSCLWKLDSPLLWKEGPRGISSDFSDRFVEVLDSPRRSSFCGKSRLSLHKTFLQDVLSHWLGQNQPL